MPTVREITSGKTPQWLIDIPQVLLQNTLMGNSGKLKIIFGEKSLSVNCFSQTGNVNLAFVGYIVSMGLRDEP